MDTRKKRFILGLAGGVLALGTIGAIASQNAFNDGIGAYATEPENMLWKHYAEVKPTYTTHGSKEFWANCSSLGEHSLTKPEKGKIEEGEDFSKTTYFASLTEEDDRYVAKLVPTVSFDSNGGTTIDSQTVEYGKKAVEPTAPTRAADEYYDAYTFDGWYNNGTKFDFATEIKESVNLVAKWKYGDSKKTIINNLKSEDFEFNNSKIATIRSGLNSATWSEFKGGEGLDSLIEEFGRTDNDGVMITAVSNDVSGASFTFPKINFAELLKGGKKICMEAGTYNAGNWVKLNGTQVFFNSNEASVQVAASLTKVLATFYLASDGNVHAYFKDTITDSPFETGRFVDVILPKAQASGTEGMNFSL